MNPKTQKKKRARIRPIKISKTIPANLSVFANAAQRMISNNLYNNIARDTHGPQLVKAAVGTGSLRELSRRSGLSPTYLSLVRTGTIRISIESYMTLLRVLVVKGGYGG